MRMLSMALLTMLLVAPASTGYATPIKLVATPSVADFPVAQYLGADKVAERRVFELLGAQGIGVWVGGSLGYSVWTSRERSGRALRPTCG